MASIKVKAAVAALVFGGFATGATAAELHGPRLASAHDYRGAQGYPTQAHRGPYAAPARDVRWVRNETPGVDQRQAMQRARIQRGVARGELTAGEAQRLREAMRDVQRMELHAKRDGVVTRHERQELHAALDGQDRLIERLSHNRRQR